MFKKILYFSIQILIFIFFISILSSRLQINTQRGPGSWELINEGSAAQYKSFAASHMYLGLSVTKGQNFFYNGQNELPRPYLHLPPGLGLTVWTVEHFFGYQNELEQFWPLFVPLVAQTISFVLIAVFAFILTRSRFFSVCATLIFSLLPISIYFGHITETEIIVLPFVLLSLISYYYYLRKSRLRYIIFLFVAVSFSAFYCWTGIFILPAMIVHYLIYTRFKLNKNHARFIIGSILWELLLVIVLFGQIYWADNFSFNTLKEGLDRRVLGYTYEKVGIAEFIGASLNNIKNMFTLPVCVASILFSLKSIFKKNRDIKLSIEEHIVFVAFLVGLGPILFPHAALQHQFLYFALIPFFVFAPIVLFSYLHTEFLDKKSIIYIIVIMYILAVFLSGKNIIYSYYTSNGQYLPEKGHFVEIFNIGSKR